MATDKAIEGVKSLKAFCDQFGPDDIYRQIFLEELFKFIFAEFIRPSSSDDDEPSP